MPNEANVLQPPRINLLDLPFPFSLRYTPGRLVINALMIKDPLLCYRLAADAAEGCGMTDLGKVLIYPQVYFIRNREWAMRVIQNPDEFPRVQLEGQMVDSFFGHGGIITTDGDAHRRARKLLQGPFKPSHIHQMLPVMLEEIRACIGEWPLGKPFILDSKFNELSLRIFARVILGARTPEEVRKCVKLGMMVKKYLGLSFLDFISPKPIAKRTPHYVYYSFMITRALQELIRNREEDLCRDSGSSYIPDVLTNLIRVRDKTAGTHNSITDEDIETQLLNLFVGAVDTTAATSRSAIFLLLKHPEWLRRLYEEAQNPWSDQVPLAEQLNGDERRIVTWTELETTRLEPAGYVRTRQVANDAQFGSYTVEGGSILLVSPYALHRLQENFPKPNEFAPEDNFPGGKKAYPDSFFEPFLEDTVHVCIGKFLARAQVRMTLTEVFRYVRMELTRRAKPRIKVDSFLGYEGLEVILSKR